MLPLDCDSVRDICSIWLIAVMHTGSVISVFVTVSDETIIQIEIRGPRYVLWQQLVKHRQWNK